MAARAAPYHRTMTTTSTTFAPPASSPSSVRSQALLAGVVLAGFLAYTLWVMTGHGLLGFLVLAGEQPWAMQLLLDLAIACAFGLRWVFADARRLGIAFWPFVALTVTCGSVGLLGYVVWRGVRPYRS